MRHQVAKLAASVQYCYLTCDTSRKAYRLPFRAEPGVGAARMRSREAERKDEKNVKSPAVLRGRGLRAMDARLDLTV